MIDSTLSTERAVYVPAMTDLDQDPLEVIESGDWVKVDADNGVVEITKH